MTGGAPHEIREKIQDADWAPDGATMAIVRDVAEGSQLEYPPDKVLYKAVGPPELCAPLAQGDRIAFFDHPTRIDDGGTVAVVDLSGKKTTLAGPFSLRAGPGVVARRQRRSGSPRPTPSNASSSRSASPESCVASPRYPATSPFATFRSPDGCSLTHDLERTPCTSSAPATRRTATSPGSTGPSPSISPRTAMTLLDRGGRRRVHGGPAPDRWVADRPPESRTAREDCLPTGSGRSSPLRASRTNARADRPRPADSAPALGRAPPGSSTWFPDGKQILYAGIESGHAPRIYVRGSPPAHRAPSPRRASSLPA